MDSIIKLLGEQRNRMDDRNIPTTLAQAVVEKDAATDIAAEEQVWY